MHLSIARTKTHWRAYCHGCLDRPPTDVVSGVVQFAFKVGPWEHVDAADATHSAVPEQRAAIDATCPSCGYGEVGYSFRRELFGCSRCGWEGSERPAA